MLMAHPTVLRNLVERYEALRESAEGHEGERPRGAVTVSDPDLGRQLQDTVYTLCVSTGTRDVEAALVAARAHIDRYLFAERGVLEDDAA